MGSVIEMMKRSSAVISKAIANCVVSGLVVVNLLAGSMLVGCSASSLENRRSLVVSTPSPDQIQILGADLVPFISEPNTSMLLVRVVGVKLAKQMEGDVEMEVGMATMEVLEVLHSKTLVKGTTIEVPVKRVAAREVRVKNPINQWNNLTLMPGELLLLAGRIISVPNVLMGQAAIRVKGPEDPAVNAARQCYVIEESKDPEKKRTLLEDALTSPQDILRFYALDALGRRAILPREVGVEMIAKALASDKTAPDDKMDLGMYLTRNFFFNNDLGADRANQRIVAALAAQLVKETDAEKRSDWVNLLSSCVLSEFSPKKEVDRSIRSALIAPIKTPTNAEVTSTLTKLLHQGDEEERERVRELLAAWRAAGTVKT